jgi:spermidine/putrescine transport system permease protein
MAAALLAFSLSIDDFIITYFVRGTSNTFPIWVWASIRANLPPQIHVIGTIVFVSAVGLVVISTILGNRSSRAPGAVVAPR